MLRTVSKLWDSFKEYIILIILILTGLVFLSLNYTPAVKNLKAVAFGSFAAVTSLVSDAVNITKLKSENEKLRRQNAELMLQVNLLRYYGITNHELKDMLGYKDTVKYPLIPAHVVSKSLTASQSSLTLNVGISDSVKPGMPVVNGEGLIGIVHSVSENYSIVRTLKNRDLNITVKNERSRADAILKWNGEDLVLVDVPKTYDIEPGDRIITSDLSSIVAVPIGVGVVTQLSKVETGIFNEVKIKPFVDFIRVEHVFVLGIVESKQKNNLELNFYRMNR
jgi:rod shape-determining protein MreC